MRPNLLLITTDQHRGDGFGFEGRRVSTPHIDRLAREGTRFSACVTPNLVCQPARASILTGLLPLTHGVRDNGIDLPEPIGEAGFAGTLTKAGYQTHFVGKAHFSTQAPFQGVTGRPECRGSSHEYGAAWSGPYMGFATVELFVHGHTLFRLLKPPHGLHYEAWFHADGRGEEKLALYRALSPTRDRATLPFHSLLPPAWHTSTWVGDRTIGVLDRTPPDRPFCLWVSFPDPHYPFDAPVPWSRLHHPDEVDLPRHWTLDLERRPWWHRAFIEGRSDPILEIRNYALELLTDPRRQEGALRDMIANYYGMISLVDHNVGRILIRLDELGLSSNTLVVLTADHGDFLGDHGLVLKGPCAYEGLLRCGLVVRGPAVLPGRVVDEPVSTIDLAPTVLDYAATPAPGPTHGRSLRALLEGHPVPRDFAYQEWDMATFDGSPDLRLRTVRTKRHKLTIELGSGEGELYDLGDDPDEMVNRFHDAGGLRVRRELEAMIAARPADVLEPLLERIGYA